MQRILFHGTGARRRQSIEQRGLLARPDSYVYATSNLLIAAVFATARAEQEDDWGLIVAFKANGDWEVDPQFPESYRRRQDVSISDILSIEVIDPMKEVEAYNWLKQFVDTMKIKII